LWVASTIGLFDEIGHVAVESASLLHISSLGGLSDLDLSNMHSTADTVDLCDSPGLYEATLLSEFASQLWVDC